MIEHYHKRYNHIGLFYDYDLDYDQAAHKHHYKVIPFYTY